MNKDNKDLNQNEENLLEKNNPEEESAENKEDIQNEVNKVKDFNDVDNLKVENLNEDINKKEEFIDISKISNVKRKSNMWNGIFVTLMVVIIIALGAIFIKMTTPEPLPSVAYEDEYNVKYFDINKKTKEEKQKIFDDLMQVGTSPTEIKFVFNKIKDDLSFEEKELGFSMYLNHIQYFSQTYNNVAAMYEHIFSSLNSNIDFTQREAAYKISDKVLRNLLLEIWDSNMYLVLDPTVGSSVMVDYEGLKEEFKDCIGDTTNKYFELKELAVSGGLSNPDGSISYAKLADFMNETYKFIDENREYNLVDDAKFLYVTAAQMYLNVYNRTNSDPYTYTDEELAMYKKYVEDNPNTPIKPTVELILSDCAANNNQLEDGNIFNIQEAFQILRESD